MAKFASVEEYLAAVPEALREVAEKARAVVDAALPGVEAALWHGQPTWSLGNAPGRQPVCFLKAHKQYVTLGLWQGQDVADPSGRLEPGARRMAYAKLRTLDDIDAELVTGWLHEARERTSQS
jgi:hypothetical protein